MEIHILLGGEQLGPFSETQVRQYLGEGLVSPSDLASYEGAPDWQALDHILAKLSPPDPTGEDEPTLPVTPDVAPADAPVADAPPTLPMHNDAPETLGLPPPPTEAEPVVPLTATQRTKRKLGKIVIQPILPLEPTRLDATSTTSLPIARKKPKTGKTQLTLEPLRPTTALPPISAFQPREKKPAKLRTEQLAFSNFSPKPTSPPTPVPSTVSTSPDFAAASTVPPPPLPLLPEKTYGRTLAKTSVRQLPRGLLYAGGALALLLVCLAVIYFYLSSARHQASPANPENAPPPPSPQQTQTPAAVPSVIAVAPTTAADFAARGAARESAADLDGAISDLTQAVTLDPKNVEAFYKRGLAREAKGDLDPALADFSQAITFDPKDADAFSHRGFIKQTKGDLDGALADYNQALLLNPKISAAYYNQGVIETQKGYLDAAIADFDHALDIEPTDHAYYNRGNAKGSEGNLDGAIADYTQALALNPKLAAAFLKRGLARQSKADSDGALDDFSHAIALNSSMAVAYFNRGLIKVQRGDMEGAIDDSTQAITLDPKNGSAYCNRGMARYGTGDLDGARADLAKFCELAPRDGGADDARIYLWLIATEQNPQGTADEELSTALLNEWNSAPEDLTSKIAAFLLGHIREDELIANAASPDPTREPPQYCRVWYFAGMKRLLSGDMKNAIMYFQKSLTTYQKSLCEYVFAQAELKALGQKPGNTAQAQAQPGQ